MAIVRTVLQLQLLLLLKVKAATFLHHYGETSEGGTREIYVYASTAHKPWGLQAGDYVALKSCANVFWKVDGNQVDPLKAVKLSTIDGQRHGLGGKASWKTDEGGTVLVSTRDEHVLALQEGARTWFGDTWASTVPKANSDPHERWKEILGSVVSHEDLARFYNKYDKSKVHAAREYAQRYHDDPLFLVETLRKKYGDAPVPTLSGQKDMYIVLGISRTATDQEVIEAYQNQLERSVVPIISSTPSSAINITCVTCGVQFQRQQCTNCGCHAGAGAQRTTDAIHVSCESRSGGAGLQYVAKRGPEKGVGRGQP
jgi:hypothetical protein